MPLRSFVSVLWNNEKSSLTKRPQSVDATR